MTSGGNTGGCWISGDNSCVRGVNGVRLFGECEWKGPSRTWLCAPSFVAVVSLVLFNTLAHTGRLYCRCAPGNFIHSSCMGVAILVPCSSPCSILILQFLTFSLTVLPNKFSSFPFQANYGPTFSFEPLASFKQHISVQPHTILQLRLREPGPAQGPSEARENPQEYRLRRAPGGGSPPSQFYGRSSAAPAAVSAPERSAAAPHLCRASAPGPEGGEGVAGAPQAAGVRRQILLLK